MRFARVLILSIRRKAGSRMTFTPKPLHAPSTTLVSLHLAFNGTSAHHILLDDDHAVAALALALNKTSTSTFLKSRSLTSPKSIFNNATGFMEARNLSGAWAGQDAGWTEGDMWAYTFDVVHALPGLVARKGGNASFVRFLDEHFDGGACPCVCGCSGDAANPDARRTQ